MPRARYIDWTRGLAVLIMLGAHALDAWALPSTRSSPAFRFLLVLGGFAAPLFLWLAGLSLALGAEHRLGTTGRRASATEAVVRRGIEVFILAFLFRLQAFVVSPGSWLVTVFKVDILNVMGPALAGAGLVWGACRGPRRAAVGCALVAAVIAMVTPLLATAAWVKGMPLWLQWYIRPFGDQTTFTLFPWSGFVFAGACCGSLMATSTDPRSERRLLASLSAAGVGLLWLGFYTASLPSIYAAGSFFWTTSPTFFAIRVGSMLLILAGFFVISRIPGLQRRLGLLEVLGRNSLFIYWIHVEVVYGYATWLLHGKLPLWGIGLGFIGLVLFVYRALGVRDRLVEAWRANRSLKSAQPVVSA